MNTKINFKSRYSFFFYFFICLFLLVFGFALYKLITGDLDLLGFIFLILLSFLIGYFFSFRFDCQITLDSKYLKIKYVIPFRKTIDIDTDQIVEVDKHEDAIKRYHKKIFINTFAKSYLVRYNISDNSDEEFLKILHEVTPK